MMFFFTLLAASFAQQNATFELITKGQLAFKEGGTFYRLGVTAAEFEKEFGPPEKRSKADGPEGYTGNCKFLQYTTDGLEVLIDPKGVVKGFTFYMVPSDKYKAANIQTDTGIRKGASARQIQKLHGKPYKRKEFNMAGFDWLTLTYKFESLVIEFKFDKGVFETMGIYAGYIPFLGK
jgi:hypothetical protein